MFNRLMIGLIFASIVVLAVGVWRVLDVPLRGIVISGELTAMERSEVQSLLAAQQVRGVLSTSLRAMGDSLAGLRWARNVSVRRLWPNKLEVVLDKANPVVRWGKAQYLSADGDVLSLPDAYPGLPRFDVAVASPQQAMEVYRLLDQIAARDALGISSLDQNGQGEWALALTKGPRVLLGAQELNERMHRFLLVHRRVLRGESRSAQYVDARYPSGVAIRFDDREGLEDDLLVAGSGGFSDSITGGSNYAEGN